MGEIERRKHPPERFIPFFVESHMAVFMLSGLAGDMYGGQVNAETLVRDAVETFQVGNAPLEDPAHWVWKVAAKLGAIR